MTPGDSPLLDALRPSVKIGQKYVLGAKLGQGGMGSVWEATHAELGHRVAIKFLDERHAGRADLVLRFLQEARAAARLNSRNVVKVFDHGRTDEGLPFLVMERLEGESLRDLLQRQGQLSPADLVRVLTQAARGLSRAHEAGIFHRDLKPENLFLHRDEDGEIVKIVDFGIAKFHESLLDTPSLTDSGALIGTPSYMSPEQSRGQRSLDGRSDLWALGVIAFECLLGQRPFTGVNVGDLILAINTRPHPEPSLLSPELPLAFDDWMRRALAKAPSDRFASAAELASELARALDSAPAALAPPRTVVRSASASEGSPSLIEAPTLAEPTPSGVGPAPALDVRSSAPPAPASPAPRRSLPWGLALLGGAALLGLLALRPAPAPVREPPATAGASLASASAAQPPSALALPPEPPAQAVPAASSAPAQAASSQPASAASQGTPAASGGATRAAGKVRPATTKAGDFQLGY